MRRTDGSAQGVSPGMVKPDPPIAQRYQSLGFQVVIRQSLLNARSFGTAPWTFTGDATCHGRLHMNTQLHQVSHFGARLAPLSPVGHPDAAANPVIQIATALVAGGNAKVVDPATKVLADPEELIVHRHTPIPVRQYPNALLELAQRVRVPMNLGSLEGESQELAFIGSDDPALGRIDRQFQTMLQVVADAGQHPVTRASSGANSPPAYASYDVLVHPLAVLLAAYFRPAFRRPILTDWPLPFASG